MASRDCKKSADCFCYICGELAVERQKLNITTIVRQVYCAYFGVKIGDQEKTWAPHYVCQTCVEGLRRWLKGEQEAFRFEVPMVWQEPKNHRDDCYFCSTGVHRFNLKNKKNIVYPNLQSAIRPVPHGPEIPVPTRPGTLPEINDFTNDWNEDFQDNSQNYKPAINCAPELFSQSELNDLVGDLQLTKEAAELFGSRLKEKKFLASGTSFSWFRNREKKFVPFFPKTET